MPLNRMVKPTSGICCEFAQKHDAEFMHPYHIVKTLTPLSAVQNFVKNLTQNP